MKIKGVLYAIGRLLQIMGAVMLVPLCISMWDERHIEQTDIFSRPETLAFLIAILSSVLLGTVLSLVFRAAREQQGAKEGFGIVTLGWASLALVGAIPFMVWFSTTRGGLSPDSFPGIVTDAYFEIMSGFSTTGATILTDIEILPRSLLFWRSLTHWLGGMGIITLALAIFPAMGVGGYQMFRGEVPGPSADRLRPRLRETAIVLWGVYALLSAVETGLLMLGGMNLFESLCHTFGTMATGGFSTRNASIGAYNSAYIDWVITVFMFLAGVNFLIHYRLLFKRDWTAVRENREFHFYVGTIVIGARACGVLGDLRAAQPVTGEQEHLVDALEDHVGGDHREKVAHGRIEAVRNEEEPAGAGGERGQRFHPEVEGDDPDHEATLAAGEIGQRPLAHDLGEEGGQSEQRGRDRTEEHDGGDLHRDDERGRDLARHEREGEPHQSGEDEEPEEGGGEVGRWPAGEGVVALQQLVGDGRREDGKTHGTHREIEDRGRATERFSLHPTHEVR